MRQQCEMSPRKEVSSLKQLCVKKVTTQLIQALSDYEGQNQQVVEDYFKESTFEILQELLKSILYNVNLDAATRFSCLKALMRRDVRKLDTGMFPHSYDEDILNLLMEKGGGLQQLNLKGVWVMDHPFELSKLIKALTSLKLLFIPHMASDPVLEAISGNCNLTYLDISGEASYSAEALSYLVLQNLQVLDIGYFGKPQLSPEISQEDSLLLMGKLIQNLGNLRVIKTYSFSGQALKLVHRQNPNFVSKLVYIHDTLTDVSTIEAVIKTCPNLESIYIDTPGDRVLEKLKRLKRIHTLKLTKMKMSPLLDYLRNGDNIQTLKLNHHKDSFLDLSEICLGVCNLQKLECFQMRLSYGLPDVFFMALQEIELSYCEVYDSTVKFLLQNSPFLKKVHLGCEISLTDGDVFRLCAESDFYWLEELWISSARGLTVTSVELLMGHCQNLKVLGELKGWNVSHEEMDYLRTIIIKTNMDLKLLPALDFL